MGKNNKTGGGGGFPPQMQGGGGDAVTGAGFTGGGGAGFSDSWSVVREGIYYTAKELEERADRKRIIALLEQILAAVTKEPSNG